MQIMYHCQKGAQFESQHKLSYEVQKRNVLGVRDLQEYLMFCEENDEQGLNENRNDSISELNLENSCFSLKELQLFPKISLLNLAQLWFGSSQLSTPAVKSIVLCSFIHLQILHLGNNQIDDMSVSALAQGNWPELIELGLSNNSIGSRGLMSLSKGNWPKLQALMLDINKFSDDGYQSLSTAAWFSNLKWVGIAGNHISQISQEGVKRGLKTLFQGLEEEQTLPFWLSQTGSVLNHLNDANLKGSFSNMAKWDSQILIAYDICSNTNEEVLQKDRKENSLTEVILEAEAIESKNNQNNESSRTNESSEESPETQTKIQTKTLNTKNRGVNIVFWF